jgi:hypothetical protein
MSNLATAGSLIPPLTHLCICGFATELAALREQFAHLLRATVLDGDPGVVEPEFVVWVHLGTESVFYPPGSAQEHLVIEHGIPSVAMHWKVKGTTATRGTITSSRTCGRARSAIWLPSPMATSRPHDLGAHLGHAAADNSGHQRAAADSAISALTCTKPWDQGHRGRPS